MPTSCRTKNQGSLAHCNNNIQRKASSGFSIWHRACQYTGISILSSETISRWSLFFESTYYFKDPIQYVRFVLLDTRTAEQEHITWCEDYLLQVDIEQNPFVCWNGEQLSSISNHDRKHANIYVEILKVGEIETRCGHWDKVKETRKRKNNDASVNLSLSPLLRSEGDSFVDTGTATE